MGKARRAKQRSFPPGPRGGDCRRNSMRMLSLFIVLPVVLSNPGHAARWDIVPSLALRETYTDNLFLVGDALKQSDWVTQLIPGISIAATGAQLRFNANYAPEITYYARGLEDNKIFNQGNAFGLAELAKELLFLEAGGNVNQYNVAIQGPLTTNNVNVTGNRVTVGSYFASPYLRRQFGSEVQAEVRYTYSGVNTNNNPNLSNSVADRVNVKLGNGPAYRLLTWNLDYSKETIHYDTQQDTDTEVVSAKARRLIFSTVGLLGQVGHDYYKSGNIVPASEGPNWSAGLDWTPSPSTRLAGTAGQRFYGDTYMVDFRHRTRLTTWSAGYTQDVTTARTQFLIPATTSTAGYLDTLYLARVPDPAARQKAVDNFMARAGLPPSLNGPVNVFSTQLFLVKRWDASAGFLGVRNVLIANVFKYDSEGVAGDLLLPNAPNASKQTGTSMLWNWRITPQNALNVGGLYSRNEIPITGQVDHVANIGIALTRQIQPRVSGTLGYRRQQNNSNVNAAEFSENAGFATLQIRF